MKSRHGPVRAARPSSSRQTTRPAPDSRRTQRTKPTVLSNQQTLGVRHEGPRISRRSDPDEQRASRAAESFVSSTDAAPRPHQSRLQVASGSPLPPEAREPYERFFGADLSNVPVHDDSRSHRAASALRARAFVHAGQVYLGANVPDLSSAPGQRLLAHELSHVVDRTGSGGSGAFMRQEVEGDTEAGGMCVATPPAPALTLGPPQPEPLMCEIPRPAALGSGGTLQERIEQFKQRVRMVAVQRLRGNIASLDLWADLIEKTIPDELLGATALTQSGGLRAYLDLQDVSNPATRQVLASQAAGRYRACTGCHLLTQAHAFGASSPHIGPEWLSPNQRRAGATEPGFPLLNELAPGQPSPFRSAPGPSTGYVPPPASTAEGALMTALPDPSRIFQLIEAARPIFETLGPDGYQVLPARILEELTTRSMADVRREVIKLIRQRQWDYGRLAEQIRTGELSWDTFSPVIHDLLSLADPDVAAAIRAELESKRRWEIAKAIFIGIVSIATLLVPVLAPGSAALMATVGAADIGLAVYGAMMAPGLIRKGQLLSLATGANNVIDPATQQSAGLSILSGFLGIVLAPLGVLSGTSRLASSMGRWGAVAGESTALVRAGQSIQRGDFIIEMAEDGAIIATSTNRPDLLIIVRGDTATLYQSMGPGGMRVVSSVKVSEVVPATEAAASTAASGGRALPGTSGTQRLLTSGARTGDQESREFMEWVAAEGGTGPIRSSDPFTMIPHAGAAEARGMLGLSGSQYQSAHELPQAVGASWGAYNPRAALTTLQERSVHTAMDAFWKSAFQQLRRQGRTTTTAQEVFDIVAESIRRAPFEAGYAESMVFRLHDEMFVEFGLSPTTQLTLPYPNIRP